MKIMRRTSLLGVTFLCLLAIEGFGQEEKEKSYRYYLDNDKHSFEEIMETETRISERNDSLDHSHTYYLIPQELPEWFFAPGEHATSDRFFIGISNPGMDSVRAVNLAKSRAEALCVLSEKMQVDNVSDNFMVSREHNGKQSQYLDFTRLSRGMVLKNVDFILDEVFYTKYEEAIVLVSLHPSRNKAKEKMKVNGELMQLAREDDYGMENTVFCKLDIKTYLSDGKQDTVSSEYIYKGRDRKFNLYTLFQGDSIDFPVHPYRYVSSCDTINSDSYVVHNSLSTGLWNSFINTLFSNVSYYNKNLKSSVKSSYDNYSLKSQGIVRTVSRNYLSYSLNRIIIDENEMAIRLSWQEYK
jgi:hypothetical protein